MFRALVGNKIRLVDGNEGTVNHLVSTVRPYLSTEPAPHTRIAFYSSGAPDEPARVRRLMQLLR